MYVVKAAETKNEIDYWRTKSKLVLEVFIILFIYLNGCGFETTTYAYF